MSTRIDSNTAILRYAATPPTDEQIAQIRQILAKRFRNKAIALELQKDDQLTGGFVISYGNFEYDWSDRGRESQLESGLIVSHDNFLRRRNPEENIISILKGRIEEFELYAEAKEIGTVLEIGDGIATILASLFGAPANTTYGENTGVLSLTKVYDPVVIRIAAGFAILFAFSPKVAAVIGCMPTATCGGVSLVLYGMISAVGVRNIVETQVDFTKSRNVIIAALILVLSIGIKYSAAGALAFQLGSLNISLSGLAVGAIVGIVLNAILPGKDFKFEMT